MMQHILLLLMIMLRKLRKYEPIDINNPKTSIYAQELKTTDEELKFAIYETF